MVVFSFNKRRGIKLAAIAVFAAFMIALCAVITLEKKQPVAEFATADEIGRYITEAPDTEAQMEFLRQFGLKADAESKRSDSVNIPAEFDETYSDYNELQKAIGLDLTPFRGEKVSRVTYKLKNTDKYAVLLIFKAHVIGGHLNTGIYGDAYEALNQVTV